MLESTPDRIYDDFWISHVIQKCLAVLRSGAEGRTPLRHRGFNANRVLFVWTLPYIPPDPLRNEATVPSLRYLASETVGDGGGMIREWISASHFFNFIVSPWSCCKREFPVTVLPMCETELTGQPGIAFPFSVSVSRSLSLSAPPRHHLLVPLSPSSLQTLRHMHSNTLAAPLSNDKQTGLKLKRGGRERGSRER